MLGADVVVRGHVLFGDDQHVRRCLRAAKAVGATIMRCYLGSGSDRRGTIPIEGHAESMLNTMRAVRSEALDLGVKFAVENHAGDLLAREMKTLLTEAGTDLAGACLDTGNPVWMAEDPLLTMETGAAALALYRKLGFVRQTLFF